MEVDIKDDVTEELIRTIERRHKHGMMTYGTSMSNNTSKSLEEWIDDAIEEAIDFAQYLLRIKQEFRMILAIRKDAERYGKQNNTWKNENIVLL